jgi:hypothetical protein
MVFPIMTRSVNRAMCRDGILPHRVGVGSVGDRIDNRKRRRRDEEIADDNGLLASQRGSEDATSSGPPELARPFCRSTRVLRRMDVQHDGTDYE